MRPPWSSDLVAGPLRVLIEAVLTKTRSLWICVLNCDRRRRAERPLDSVSVIWDRHSPEFVGLRRGRCRRLASGRRQPSTSHIYTKPALRYVYSIQKHRPVYSVPETELARWVHPRSRVSAATTSTTTVPKCLVQYIAYAAQDHPSPQRAGVPAPLRRPLPQ